MRTLLIIAGTLAITAAAGFRSSVGRTEGLQHPSRQVVLAELFTSEGCSSCPPADALLQHLNGASPVEGVEVLGIEEHVDYWDNLGWRDPFSSSAFTRRQTDYDTHVFRNGDIYTPQVVIDGAFDAIGSDARSVRDAVTKAAARPGVNLTIAAAAAGTGARATVRIDVPASVGRRRDADIVVAVVEDGLSSHVDRGENRGRTLGHAPVVRSMSSIGVLPAGASTGEAAANVAIDPRWQSTRVRLVAFVQEKGTMRILGAAAGALPPRAVSK